MSDASPEGSPPGTKKPEWWPIDSAPMKTIAILGWVLAFFLGAQMFFARLETQARKERAFIERCITDGNKEYLCRAIIE